MNVQTRVEKRRRRSVMNERRDKAKCGLKESCHDCGDNLEVSIVNAIN